MPLEGRTLREASITSTERGVGSMGSSGSFQQHLQPALARWGGLIVCTVCLGFFPACSAVEAPAEPEARTVAAIQAGTNTSARRRLPPDYARARIADEAVRTFGAAHPFVPSAARTSEPVGARTVEGGVPDARFLLEPELALGPGVFIADITFLSAGEPDDYALEATGRFRIQTTRYRVRLNAVARREGDAVPNPEFDLYTERTFRPVATTSSEAPRMLAVLGDQALRPGFNLKIAVPLTERGILRGRAYGAEEGTFSEDLFRDLRSRLPRRAGGGS